MGYTHYWNQSKVKVDEGLVEDARKIIAASAADLAGWDEEDKPEVGVGRIVLNGCGAMSHEPLILDSESKSEFEFCKTARKPYDEVVGAILLAAEERCGGIDLRSDGFWSQDEDWGAPRKLFEKALGRAPQPPQGVVDEWLELAKDGEKPVPAWKYCGGWYEVGVGEHSWETKKMNEAEFSDFVQKGGYEIRRE